jgi:hypothetical protein
MIWDILFTFSSPNRQLTNRFKAPINFLVAQFTYIIAKSLGRYYNIDIAPLFWYLEFRIDAPTIKSKRKEDTRLCSRDGGPGWTFCFMNMSEPTLQVDLTVQEQHSVRDHSFDTDSFLIGLDNCASFCMTNSEADLWETQRRSVS